MVFARLIVFLNLTGVLSSWFIVQMKAAYPDQLIFARVWRNKYAVDGQGRTVAGSALAMAEIDHKRLSVAVLQMHVASSVSPYSYIPRLCIYK